MTRVTANLILCVMAGTWSYLSIREGLLLPVSEQFVWLAAALASGEGFSLVSQRFGKKPEQAT